MTDTITIPRALLRKALHALNIQTPLSQREFDARNEAIAALRSALEQQQQEDKQ